MSKESALCEEVKRCGCGGIAQPPHECPFQRGVHGDRETLCECCEKCEWECLGNAGTDTAARIDLAIVAFQEGDISRETLTREVIAALTDGIRSEL